MGSSRLRSSGRSAAVPAPLAMAISLGLAFFLFFKLPPSRRNWELCGGYRAIPPHRSRMFYFEV